MKEEPTSDGSDPPSASLALCLDVHDANVILLSSDQVIFRVHKSLLAMSSPFFESMLSMPQPLRPSDGDLVDGLPVIDNSSLDAGLLNCLVSLLYPISPIIPDSYEKVFALLAACQKYDMVSIQSRIRAEIDRGTFPAPVGADVFRAYAIASSLGLIPEMQNAARLSLGYPMTFDTLGDDLQSFKGWALSDLIRYRKSCRDSIVSCLSSFFAVSSRCQIWTGCVEWSYGSYGVQGAPTNWLNNFFINKSVELRNSFTKTIFSPSAILEGLLMALKTHATINYTCASCIRVHMEGNTFSRELEDQLAQALDKVSSPFKFWPFK